MTATDLMATADRLADAAAHLAAVAMTLETDLVMADADADAVSRVLDALGNLAPPSAVAGIARAVADIAAGMAAEVTP